MNGTQGNVRFANGVSGIVAESQDKTFNLWTLEKCGLQQWSGLPRAKFLEEKDARGVRSLSSQCIVCHRIALE